MKNRQQEIICKQFAATGSCSYGARCRFSHQLQSASPAPPTSQTPSGTAGAAAEWSPVDDGIEVRLPDSGPTEKPPSREEVNAYINGFLNGVGQPRRRRLPVFEEICPSSDKN